MRTIIVSILLLTIANLVNGQKFNTEQEFINYFEQNCNTLDPIEGIWLVQFSKSLDNHTYMISYYYKVAIIKEGFKYIEYPLKDGFVTSNIDFIKFSKNYSYSYIVYNYNIIYKKTAEKTIAINQNSFEFILSSYDMTGKKTSFKFYFKLKYSKTYPLNCKEINKTEKIDPSTGTGFAISTDGHIATNFHVIKDTPSWRSFPPVHVKSRTRVMSIW